MRTLGRPERGVLAMVYALAALAALCNACASVLERGAAATTTEDDTTGVALIKALIRKPAWLGGIAAMIGAFALQAAALDRGRLGVVQPILVIELPITLVLAAVFFRRKVAGRDWRAAIAMSAGLAIVLLAADPSGGQRQPNFVAWGFLLIAATGGTLWLAGLGRAARGAARAGLYAIAAGMGFGLTAVFIKGATERFSSGFGATVTAWQLWATFIAGVVSLYLLQRALQAGSLAIVQPALTIVDPIVAVVCGVMLFGETLKTGWALLPELIGIAGLVYGAITLSRSPLVVGGQSTSPADDFGDGEPAPGRPADASAGGGTRHDPPRDAATLA